MEHAVNATGPRAQSPKRSVEGQGPNPACGDTCIFVVGMHRSGTSATTGLLGQLGLGMPRIEDRMKAKPRNQKGHWESKSLNQFDERLLNSLGGSWIAPPALEANWEQDASVTSLRSEASALFGAVFGPRPVAWKDPRSSIVLPFWRTVLPPPAAAILVYRDPLEVAASLASRNGVRLTHGLALWERYTRSALANLEGLPTYVVSYQALIDSTDQLCDELIDFLADVSVSVDRSLRAEAMRFMDPGLRHERAPVEDLDQLPASTRAVLDDLHSLGGPHHPWKSPNLGEEPSWVADVLAAFHDLEVLQRRYGSLEASRPIQWARKLERVKTKLSRR